MILWIVCAQLFVQTNIDVGAQESNMYAGW